MQGKKGSATWKRKAQREVEIDGPRKKRVSRGDDYSSSLASKGRRGSGQAVNRSGSGIAVAVVQPRKSQ
jgi:hypothetical protein